jgi:thioredoxin 1
MKKVAVIIVSVVVLLLVGGLIIAWSVYQKGEDKLQTAYVKDFTDDNFEVEVVEVSKKQPVLVDFYADWCLPCRMLDPILQDVAKDLIGKAVIGRVNTDKNLLGRRFGISRIPAIFVIKDGEIKNSFYGVVPKETIVKALAENGS